MDLKELEQMEIIGDIVLGIKEAHANLQRHETGMAQSVTSYSEWLVYARSQREHSGANGDNFIPH